MTGLTFASSEMYIEQGKQQGELERSRKILLRLLRKRFKKLPRKLEARIAAATSIHDLDTWLDRVLDAETLADVGVPVE